jgi:hypothetical protein
MMPDKLGKADAEGVVANSEQMMRDTDLNFMRSFLFYLVDD